MIMIYIYILIVIPNKILWFIEVMVHRSYVYTYYIYGYIWLCYIYIYYTYSNPQQDTRVIIVLE